LPWTTSEEYDTIRLGTGRGGGGAEELPSTGNAEAHWEDTSHSWDIMVVGYLDDDATAPAPGGTGKR